MKKLFYVLCALWLAMPAVQAQEAAASAEPQDALAAVEQDPAERNKMLYTLGYLEGNNLKRQLVLDNEDDYKALSQGMRDSLLGKASQTDVEAYKPYIIAKYEHDAQVLSQKREEAQQEYLQDFAKGKNVKVLDNGAMIQLSRRGKGRTPSASSKVTAHYEGRLIDGTKFDSSYERKEPLKFELSGVIPCWSKAIQYMRPGAKATIVCPANTAYGNRPVGPIPANSALVFDVELISIDD